MTGSNQLNDFNAANTNQLNENVHNNNINFIPESRQFVSANTNFIAEEHHFVTESPNFVSENVNFIAENSSFPTENNNFPINYQIMNIGNRPDSHLRPNESQQDYNERRSAHNALERQRREGLNTKFLELAHVLPSLRQVRRPSKSMIVSKSLEFVATAEERESQFQDQLEALKRENEQLMRQAQISSSIKKKLKKPIKQEKSPTLENDRPSTNILVNKNQSSHVQDVSKPTSRSPPSSSLPKRKSPSQSPIEQASTIRSPPIHTPPTHSPPTHSPPNHSPSNHSPPTHNPSTYNPPTHSSPTRNSTIRSPHSNTTSTSVAKSPPSDASNSKYFSSHALSTESPIIPSTNNASSTSLKKANLPLIFNTNSDTSSHHPKRNSLVHPYKSHLKPQIKAEKRGRETPEELSEPPLKKQFLSTSSNQNSLSLHHRPMISNQSTLVPNQPPIISNRGLLNSAQVIVNPHPTQLHLSRTAMSLSTNPIVSNTNPISLNQANMSISQNPMSLNQNIMPLNQNTMPSMDDLNQVPLMQPIVPSMDNLQQQQQQQPMMDNTLLFDLSMNSTNYFDSFQQFMSSNETTALDIIGSIIQDNIPDDFNEW